VASFPAGAGIAQPAPLGPSALQLGCDEKQFDSPYRGRDKVAYQPRMKAMPYNGKTKPATIDPDTPTMILARGPNPATQKRQYSPSSHRQHQQRAK